MWCNLLDTFFFLTPPRGWRRCTLIVVAIMKMSRGIHTIKAVYVADKRPFKRWCPSWSNPLWYWVERGYARPPSTFLATRRWREKQMQSLTLFGGIIIIFFIIIIIGLTLFYINHLAWLFFFFFHLVYFLISLTSIPIICDSGDL